MSSNLPFDSVGNELETIGLGVHIRCNYEPGIVREPAANCAETVRVSLLRSEHVNVRDPIGYINMLFVRTLVDGNPPMLSVHFQGSNWEYQWYLAEQVLGGERGKSLGKLRIEEV